MTKMDTLITNDIVSLHTIKNICKKILNNYSNINCCLFGSYAKGNPTKKSDIDLLLLFDKKTYNYNTVLQIKNELQEIFLTINKYCNPIYGHIDNISTDSYILFRQYIHLWQIVIWSKYFTTFYSKFTTKRDFKLYTN